MSQFKQQENLSEQKQQAINWLIRLRSDDMTDEELCEFADWLAFDHSNADAFSSTEALFDQMAQVSFEKNAKNQCNSNSSLSVLATDVQKNNFFWKKSGVRQLFIPSLAIAAVWLVAVVLFFPQQRDLFGNLLSDYHTETGELREIELSDGSRLLLNTNSAISVAFDDNLRKIILHHGQVRFSVAKDKFRPFEVFVGKLKVRALGTVFQIYKTDQNTRLSVQEHAVSARVIGRKERGVTVQKGRQLYFKDSLLQSHEIELHSVTAWQEKRLVINDQPLSFLVSELERYRNGRIFVSNNSLKNLRISGSFSLENPEEILETVCKVLDLKLTKFGVWRLLHK